MNETQSVSAACVRKLDVCIRKSTTTPLAGKEIENGKGGGGGGEERKVFN